MTHFTPVEPDTATGEAATLLTQVTKSTWAGPPT